MPVKRRVAKQRTYREISEPMWRWLKDGIVPNAEIESGDWWAVFKMDRGEAEVHRDGAASKLMTMWRQVREELLTEWIAEHPGYRPRLWWMLEAPRRAPGAFPLCYYDGVLQEPRRLLAGAGQPAHDVFALVPWYEFGIPTTWAGFDPNDPPAFESQASYLKRHKLLRLAEARTLTSKDYAPETVHDFLQIPEYVR